MSRRRSRERFHEPSLVPLADMLTNTVGILLFILIFTVLGTGGIVVPKRLPMEHPTEAKALYFLCTGNRLLPVDDALQKSFFEPLGKLTSYDEVDAWVRKFKARQVENDYFVVRGESEAHYTDQGFRKSASVAWSINLVPKEGKGQTVADLKLASSQFLQILTEHNSRERFIYFAVHPDSLEIFEAARALALERNFGTGWMLLAREDPFGFSNRGIPSGPQ